jgi:flavodoxin I
MLTTFLKTKSPKLMIDVKRVELATAEDLLNGDALILACGTWNTGGIEGQLNPYMHQFLLEKAATMDLKGKKVAVIGLGDHRYRYTAKATDHLEHFVNTHGGALLCESLRMVNEPYGQEKKVEEWGKKLLSKLTTP